MLGRSRVGESRGILSTLVGFREVLLKEAVKPREADGNGRSCGRNREVPERERNVDGEPGVYRYCGDTEGLKTVP